MERAITTTNGIKQNAILSVIQRYGNGGDVISKFAPQLAAERNRMLNKSVNVPTMAEMLKSYEYDIIYTMILVNLNAAMERTGIECLDASASNDIVAGMLAIPEARMLNVAYFLDFCFLLATGGYSVYGGKIINILEAFRRHVQQASQKQARMMYEYESANNAKRIADDEKRCADSWAEYTARTGKTKQELINEIFNKAKRIGK